MLKKLETKIGLAGAGFWGKNLARVFHQLGVLKIICDPSEDVRQREGTKYLNIETTASFDETLSHPEVNAVAIATPAETHYSMAKKALMANKHVYVEKPLALKESEGNDLVELANSKSLILFIGHILHYHPAITHLKKIIGDGELGKLQYIYSNRLNLGKIRQEENILWSFAPHDISLILSLVNEEPEEVSAHGSNILDPRISDTTLTHLKFPSGVSAHIFVSWLHPFKEQKLVVVGQNMMAVFEDTAPKDKKLTLYPHKITWQNGIPVPERKDGIPVDLNSSWKEPLLEECRAFVNAIKGKPFITNGREGLKVLKVLHQSQLSMDGSVDIPKDYFVHETSRVDHNCVIGKGTRIWHYSHVLKNSKIGDNVVVGQNVSIGPEGEIGDNVKIQNNVSIYEKVIIEDNVFCGPSCVFTNVVNPRSEISRKHKFQTTRIRRGATIGANATILCGITVGQYAFIGAGAVVTKDVPDYALVYGNPATIQGWVDQAGNRVDHPPDSVPC